ncbi:MAG: hypothetical protein ACRDAW_02660 [Metamycoplasmataceae bacterium]
MNEKNYYDEVIEEIKKISQTDKQQAILILKKELAMPYIPQNYETIMKELEKKLLVDEKGKQKTVTREEIIDAIFKKEDGMISGERLFLINEIPKFNWVGYEKDFEKAFNSKDIKQNIKTVIFENLINQKIDFDFKIETKTFNPKKCNSIFQSDFVSKNINDIELNSEIKDTIVKRISVEALIMFVSSLFPDNIDLKYKDITKDLINVSNFLLGKISEEKLSDIAKKISSVIINNN